MSLINQQKIYWTPYQRHWKKQIISKVKQRQALITTKNVTFHNNTYQCLVVKLKEITDWSLLNQIHLMDNKWVLCYFQSLPVDLELAITFQVIETDWNYKITKIFNHAKRFAKQNTQEKAIYWLVASNIAHNWKLKVNDYFFVG